MNVSDQLPRGFQANVDRFYQRVILATLGQLPTHDKLVVGQTSSMEEFLTRCAAQVDNHTANEAAKAFALTLDGLFERQLCRWAHAHGEKADSMKTALPACVRIGALDLAATGMAHDLEQLHLVANVVRHGEGPACKKLQATAPLLWDSAPARLLRLSAPDAVKRYASHSG